MITGVLLVSSTSLFVASVTSGAPELVSTVFAFGIVAYAIVYPPWGGPDSEGRDRRSRIAAVSVFAAFCVAIGISALQMTASLYGVGEQASLAYESSAYLSAVGIVLMAWAVCRSFCGMAYAVTGNTRVLDWIV